MLTLRFRGDTFDITLPYIEVANGDIIAINTMIDIMTVENNVQDTISMSYADFAKLIETTFDTKELVELKLQLAGTYQNVKIL